MLAYDNGYREGLKEGERDGRRRDSYRYQDKRTWQRADKGYNRSSATSSAIVNSSAQASLKAISAGYRATGRQAGGMATVARSARQDPYRYPNGGVYPDRNRYPDPYYGNQGAYGAGPLWLERGVPQRAQRRHREGPGRRRKRRTYDPLRHDWYRAGDRHYRGEYGSKERYKDVYRRAFQEGYERGYRELGYYR